MMGKRQLSLGKKKHLINGRLEFLFLNMVRVGLLGSC